ncbi:MAG: nucleoside-diphosphate sugar epimerase/dehydratase [Myxococcota bacterium]|nr:nucleoside-diphosphate sugar epimerase/dehydratase [Myxococcota bacterium]
MSRYFARGAQLFIDLFSLSAAYWFAFLFRYELDLDLQTYKLLFFTWPYVVIFKYLVLTLFGVPRFSWRYVGLQEAKRILWALGTTTGVLVLFRFILPSFGGYSVFLVIPLGVLAVDFALSFLAITGARVVRRMRAEREERDKRRTASVSRKRTLLIGAGSAGVMVAKEVAQNPNLGIKVVGFVDDDIRKIGTTIQGHRVLGDTTSMAALVNEHRVAQAVITMASVPGSKIRRIVQTCKEISLMVKIIPGIYEILDGQVNLSRIREVTIEDLLGREAVELNLDAIQAFITGKRVLITGAGGSIGSELCRQVSRFNPETLVLAEQAENALFDVHGELSEIADRCDIIPIIADICDAKRIEQVFKIYRPHVVFHAAAHKHVPMMEWNPGEAIKNNVFGTKTVADAADRFGSQAFVMISTDKAVNPTSIMGTSKRVAEIYVQGLSKRSTTKFVAVRFGNVLGSAGSVIPTFQKQIQSGGPVTVTHPDMKRYFMTIPEACQLVMEAATMGNGGEIFVLDMGEPVKIVDLARDLIRLSGFGPDEIDIEFTGVRPGEKLFEELSTAGEDMTKTHHPKIFIGKIASYPLEKVRAGLAELDRIANTTSSEDVRAALTRLVPEMREPADSDPPPAISDRPPTRAETLH